MTKNTVLVWDIAVRLFHWSLVVIFTIAYLSGEEEGQLHIYAGYAVLGLLIFRILWGFIGSRHALFRDFVYGPRAVGDYLKSLFNRAPRHYLGHNPAGGWMVLALLASLLLASVSGLKVYGVEGHGPLADGAGFTPISTAYADEDEDEKDDEGENHESSEKFWEEIHEFFANLTLLLVFVHVTGVIVSSRLHGENLVKAMITGRKAT